MVIGSHNSWSYLRPRKWWMRLIAFAARCQRVDIRTQYLKYGVRCFDLRMRYEHLEGVYAHGPVEYDMSCVDVANALFWLNEKGDCYVRVIHEARTKEQYTKVGVELFREDCQQMQEHFPNIQFWCGRNLYDWNVDYQFQGDEPTCEETYGSVVQGKKWFYGWWPWLYAVTHNKRIKARSTEKDILLIDFVDI